MAESGAELNIKDDGTVHISELAEGRVNQVEDVSKKGDIISAKCVGIDDKGRVKMSRKAALREEGGGAPPAAPYGTPPSEDEVSPSEAFNFPCNFPH